MREGPRTPEAGPNRRSEGLLSSLGFGKGSSFTVVPPNLLPALFLILTD